MKGWYCNSSTIFPVYLLELSLWHLPEGRGRVKPTRPVPTYRVVPQNFSVAKSGNSASDPPPRRPSPANPRASCGFDLRGWGRSAPRFVPEPPRNPSMGGRTKSREPRWLRAAPRFFIPPSPRRLPTPERVHSALVVGWVRCSLRNVPSATNRPPDPRRSRGAKVAGPPTQRKAGTEQRPSITCDACGGGRSRRLSPRFQRLLRTTKALGLRRGW